MNNNVCKKVKSKPLPGNDEAVACLMYGERGLSPRGYRPLPPILFRMLFAQYGLHTVDDVYTGEHPSRLEAFFMMRTPSSV